MVIAMKIRNRQSKLVELVRKKGGASVEELALSLGASKETIRRDLTELGKSGKIVKIHGGATLPSAFGEGPFQQRMSDNVEAKLRIARRAATLFKPGETIFIDTGSTTLYFSEELARSSGLTIVTNSMEIAKTLSKGQSDNQIYVLGGEFSAGNYQTVGTMVTAQIRLFRAHHTVLTIGALDDRTGVMDFNINEAQVAKAMVEQSESLTVLVDHSKLDTLASFEVCPLEAINRLICDQEPEGELGSRLKAAGCDVIVAS
jgi:DeoR/GlpR family transcriptional regulator of sugar metabolism